MIVVDAGTEDAHLYRAICELCRATYVLSYEALGIDKDKTCSVQGLQDRLVCSCELGRQAR